MDKKRFRTRELSEVYKDSGLGKWFHNQSAGGEPGWDRYNTKGEKAGKCGDCRACWNREVKNVSYHKH